MKILQLFDFFSPHGGGTVDLLYKLSRALAQRGHEVVIYTSDFKLDQAYIDSLPEVRVYPFHCVSRLAEFYLVPGMVSEIRERLEDFDIIHLLCYRSFQNIVAHHYAQKYGVPYVLEALGSLLPHLGRQGLKKAFDLCFGYRILRDASRVIAGTEAEAEEYKMMGVEPDRIRTFLPGYDTDGFAQLPSKGGFRKRFAVGEKNIILFLGRIHQIKGIDFLVRSFHKLVQERSNTILAIAGPDDGYKTVIDTLVRELNLEDKVLFTGFLSGEDKLSALVDADLLVQTSIYERGPGSPFEAVLCGTPIIVTGETGAGDVVNKLDAGYLVGYGDESGLKGLMQQILDNPAEARTKTRGARQYIIKNLAWPEKVKDYEAVYEEAIAATSRNRGA